MKIYTRTGDQGQTSLFGGARVAKNDARIEAYGTIDELSSHLGVARTMPLPSDVDAILHQVQIDLFEIGAHLASPGTSRFPGVDTARIEELERAIDAMERELAPLTTFILPGGSSSAAHLHVARTVCRRAERLVPGDARCAPTSNRSRCTCSSTASTSPGTPLARATPRNDDSSSTVP
jgi:cob(I)alamin adenosyltransferase